MARIRVYIFNHHQLGNSMIEMVLENLDEPAFYRINRWRRRRDWLNSDNANYQKIVIDWFQDASYNYHSFGINVDDPNALITAWVDYFDTTDKEADPCGQNCAMAIQWFLTKFAHIPPPSLANLSINYAGFGLFWPSFIPFPITLPGRIISNAKFHVQASLHPEIAEQYSKLFLYTCLVITACTFFASLLILNLAITILASALVKLSIATTGVATALLSTQGFFKAYNLLSAKNPTYQNNSLLFSTEDASAVPDICTPSSAPP